MLLLWHEVCFPWIPELRCIHHQPLNLLSSCKQLAFPVSADWCHGYREAVSFFSFFPPESGHCCAHLSFLSGCPPPHPCPDSLLQQTPWSLTSVGPKRQQFMRMTSWGGQTLFQLPALRHLAFIAHWLLIPVQAGLTAHTGHTSLPVAKNNGRFSFLSSLTSLLHETSLSFLKHSVSLDVIMLYSPGSSLFRLELPRVLSSSYFSSQCSSLLGKVKVLVTQSWFWDFQLEQWSAWWGHALRWGRNR